MVASVELLPGFEDYGTEANALFRICLDALSRPGTIWPFETHLQSPQPLLPKAAAVLLTLADYETSVWLDEPLASSDAVNSYLRFHSGASRATSPASADFAIVSDVNRMPSLSEFSAGTLEYPDRSTTIIAQVEALTSSGWTLSGPGIKREIGFSVTPMHERLPYQLVENRRQFPCGVDLIFVTKTHVAALPRSVIVQGEV
jgi:alpha-D-ribose 1-methylphosphonate 5-triphosphate synthase subunit PhnH